MDSIIIILLVIAAIKFIIAAIILYVVFKPDLQQMQDDKQADKKVAPAPACPFCQSKWITLVDEGQVSWEDDNLVLVTTYECQHCHFPIRHVERISAGSLKP